MRKKTKVPALMLAVLLTAGICGFAPAQSPAPLRESGRQEKSSYQGARSQASQPRSERPAAAEEPDEVPSGFSSKDKDTGSGKSPSSSKSSSASSKPKTEEELQVSSGIQDIARLAGLEARVELYSHACVVDVDEGENPYDVTWEYGKLYDAYVEEVDWDLLFDGDYYIRTFPGLAHLYHKDKALLLRHFQTVGIHEGRQGCQGFNVAAYQKNCDAKVRKAFGDNYECYYFYYAMNQKTQKGVVTTGSEKKQLATKLTHMQQEELDHVNEYRAEVGVPPIEYDAELSALACYRAYIDALEDWDAHDWLNAPENQEEMYSMMDMIEAKNWSENTVHGYNRNRDYVFKQGPATAWYINYRYSEDHYKAMTAEKYHYMGSANCYISDYKKENPRHPDAEAVYIHYDVFVPDLITPVHN